MQKSKGGRPQNGNTVGINLKTLRERRDFLKKEIQRLLFAGCQPGKGGRSVQVVGLTPDERQLVAAHQQEIRDIEATLRAFEA